MSAESETERVGVRTYVPRYQKEDWAAEAKQLDMSQAEFVRTMVQAGRRSFNLDSSNEESRGSVSDDATTGVQRLETRLLEVLDSGSYHGWDELVAALTDDIEDRLEAALSDLQERNRVQYSGRHGGYTLLDDGE